MGLPAGPLGALLMALPSALAHPPAADCDAVADRACFFSVQEKSSEPDAGQRPAQPLNTIHDVFAAIHACWLPPPADQAHEGMEISIRLSFTRDGGILGEPRFTYLTPGVPQQVRTAYERAVVATLARCTPLRFTAALGGALAGRPFAIRFIDNRSKAERRA